MRKYQNPSITRCAAVHANDRYISIQTFSGYGRTMGDPKGLQIYINANSSNFLIGSSLYDALNKSREVIPSEEPDLFDYKQIEKRSEEWIRELIERYRYKSKREALIKTKYCDVTSERGEILIAPFRHTRLEGWLGQEDDKTVVVPEMATAEQLGAAVRLALTRCL
jgi:hypothetical protein